MKTVCFMLTPAAAPQQQQGPGPPLNSAQTRAETRARINSTSSQPGADLPSPAQHSCSEPRQSVANKKLSSGFKEKIHNTCHYNRFIITGVIKIATFSCRFVPSLHTPHSGPRRQLQSAVGDRPGFIKTGQYINIFYGQEIFLIGQRNYF